METAFLLVLLTLTPAGQTAVNFVNTDDMDTCEGKTILLDNILSKGGVRIVANRCLPSRLRFSRFTHGPAAVPAGEPPKRYIYLVELGANDVKIAQSPGLRQCKMQLAQIKLHPKRKHYCASSTQAML